VHGRVLVRPAASGGFAGYAIYDDARTSPCPASYSTQTDTYETLIVLPATCTSCSCQAGGASCGSATVTCNTGGTCGEDGGTSAVLGEGCSEIDAGLALGPATSCSAGVPTATPGSCAASGGTATAGPVSFAQLSRVCAATEGPGGGCGAGSVCVAKAPSGSHGACVFETTASTAQCPAGYSNAHTTMPSATSFTDTRGCTSCACSGVAGATCSGSAALYEAASCPGDAGSAANHAPGRRHLPRRREHRRRVDLLRRARRGGGERGVVHPLGRPADGRGHAERPDGLLLPELRRRSRPTEGAAMRSARRGTFLHDAGCGRLTSRRVLPANSWRFSAYRASARIVLESPAEVLVARISAFRMHSRSDDATTVMPRRLLELEVRRALSPERARARRGPHSPIAKPAAVRPPPAKSAAQKTEARRHDTPSAFPLARDIVSPPSDARFAAARGRARGDAPPKSRLQGFVAVFALGLLVGVLASVRARSNGARAAAASSVNIPAHEVAAPIAPVPAPTVATMPEAKIELPKLEVLRATAKPRHASHSHALAVTPTRKPRRRSPPGLRRARLPTRRRLTRPTDSDDDLGAANAADNLARQELDSLIQ